MGTDEDAPAAAPVARSEGGSDAATIPGRLLAAAAVAVAAAVLSPVLWLLARAAEIGAADAVALAASAVAVRVLTNSLVLVAVVTAGAIAIGVTLAVLTVQTDLPLARLWTVTAALPLVVPSYIGAFAYFSAFGPRGELADLLAPLGVAIPTIRGLPGTALVLTLFVYPYVFLTTRAALLSFDATQLEAARTLDHGYRAAFRRVVLPQIAPGVLSGALLVALYTLSDFGTPAIMQYDVFTRVIYVELGAFGQARATVLALELLAVTAVVLALESRVGGSRGHAAAASRDAVVELGVYRWPATAVPALVATFTLVVPVGVLGVWLLRSGPAYAGGGIAFEWAYGWNSVLVSVAAAAATVVVALPVAYYAGRSDSTVAGLAERSTYVGYAMPGIVLGLALVFFGTRYAPGLYRTLPLLVFAYVVRFLPQAVGTTRSSVLGVDADLVGAARVLGEGPGGAFRRVTLPLIAPGVLAGAMLVFLTTMKELPATLILHPTGFTTLVTYIWRVQETGYYGRAALPALVLVAVSGLSMVVLLWAEGTDG
ncbi:iron ABC transporter permease [Halobacteriales archaeon QS_1_69_70]|nr:MAG: iron ABC transporter permease [Halobacteriales archaeon QS_1_69_70]